MTNFATLWGWFAFAGSLSSAAGEERAPRKTIPKLLDEKAMRPRDKVYISS